MATTKKLKIQDTNAGDLNPKRKPKPKPPSPSKAAIARKEAEMSATAKKVINQKTKKATELLRSLFAFDHLTHCIKHRKQI